MATGGRGAVLEAIRSLENTIMTSLQQQATHTQQAAQTRDKIEAARQGTSSEITSTRADLNSRITETQQAISDTRDDVNALRRNIAGLHAVVEGWRAEAAEARVAAEEARRAAEAALQQRVADHAESASRSGEPPVPESAAEHQKVLGATAGIAYAELNCHRDTWSFLVEQAAGSEHFRLPADIEEQDDGTVEVAVSGRTLIAAIDTLWRIRQRADTSPVTRALAERAYRSVKTSLDNVEPQPHTDTDTDDGAHGVVRIIIDDRPDSRKPAASTTPSQDGEPTIEDGSANAPDDQPDGHTGPADQPGEDGSE